MDPLHTKEQTVQRACMRAEIPSRLAGVSAGLKQETMAKDTRAPAEFLIQNGTRPILGYKIF